MARTMTSRTQGLTAWSTDGSCHKFVILWCCDICDFPWRLDVPRRTRISVVDMAAMADGREGLVLGSGALSELPQSGPTFAGQATPHPHPLSERVCVCEGFPMPTRTPTAFARPGQLRVAQALSKAFADTGPGPWRGGGF